MPHAMWLSVTLLTDAAHADALSEALLAHGALSVTIEDADAGTATEQPQFGEPGMQPGPLWQSSKVAALFDAGLDPADAVTAAAAQVGLAPVPGFAVEQVPERDWVRLTQSQFEPVRINRRLWVVPSWHRAPDPDAINITLDPGMAFGTGSHATTRLCLQWLCDRLRGGESVLDYGTGSGILAIAAARLGAACVVGVDIDEAALAAAQENARRNRVKLTLLHSRDPLPMQFDRVIANILTNPLRLLAPLLCARVERGGAIALCGVLAAQADDVSEAYRRFIPLRTAAELEGWVLLEGTRP